MGLGKAPAKPLQSTYREGLHYIRGFAMRALQSPCKASLESSFALSPSSKAFLCRSFTGASLYLGQQYAARGIFSKQFYLVLKYNSRT